jgi:polysaccharide pyruvyl transferase WcaK-like protein
LQAEKPSSAVQHAVGEQNGNGCPVKLVLFNVKYSPNLGDGLLSECLERELSQAAERPEVVSADLAGRRAYGTGAGQRRIALSVLERLPGPVRRIAARGALSLLVRSRLRREWRKLLIDADAVIVGGGNLIADVDLNFPMKIAGALAVAEQRKLPVAVHSVGVTDNWSRSGARLFRAAFGNSKLVTASVRDQRSRAIWDRRLVPAGICAATIAPDPGLLTALHFPATCRGDADRRHVALGITSPDAIRYHVADGGMPDALDRWLADLVGELAQREFRISLFTNGSPEDRDYLAAQASQLVAVAPGRVRIEPDFRTPADLAGFVSGCDLLLGHRMHAIIAAYSYGIPAIGFAWDVKLQSLFELIGHADRLIDPASTPADFTAALAERALADGIDRPTHARLIRQSRDSIARLATRLKEATRPDVPFSKPRQAPC